jgi:hypothetical protein
MDRGFIMIRTLSLSLTSAAALVVFASTLAAPVQAADRSIAVEAKPSKLRPVFRVEEAADQGPVDVAANSDDAGSKPSKSKFFRVEEEAPAKDAGVAETAPADPKPPKTLEFRVDEETNQVSDTPIEDEKVISEPRTETPTAPLVKDIAPKKKAAVVEEDEDITTDTAAEDIAGDQQGPVVLDDGTQTEEQAAPIVKKVAVNKRRNAYAVYDEGYDQYTDGFQPQSYNLPSCHNKSYGY